MAFPALGVVQRKFDFMNLIDRVENALGSSSVRIDHETFERCATSLLSGTYPALIPVRGGTDWGADAEIAPVDETGRVWMAITSARLLKGSLANLRSSMSSIVEHGMQGRRIIAVNLAVLSRTDRTKMERAAKGVGFELVATVDRGFFADRLIREPSWRQELLNLPGGSFSLSRFSSASAAENGTGLVGRTELLKDLASSTDDLIVSGAPGIGKSALLEQLPGGLFVVGSPADDRLLDDLLSTTPLLVVVDDAMRRREVVERLVTIRRQESPNYRIVAACWPQQVDSLATVLSGARHVELDPLPRSQVGMIANGMGIYDETLISQIIQQARGRPGWAVNLIALARSGGIDALLSGEALHDFVRGYIARAGLPSNTVILLSVLSLLGPLADDDRDGLAAFLGQDGIEVAEKISDLAIGGLLDVSGPIAFGGLRFTVLPEPLPTRLVIDAFFSGARMAPIDIRKLFDAWPDRQANIALRLVLAALYDTAAARNLAEELALAVLRQKDPAGNISDLISMSVRLSADLAGAALDLVEQKLPAQHVSSVVGHYANAFLAGKYPSSADRLLDAASNDLLDQKQRRAVLNEFVTKVRGFGIRPYVDTDALIRVSDRAIAWAGGARSAPRSATLLDLVVEILAPTFEEVHGSPTDRLSINMTSAALSPDQMDMLIDRVWLPFTAQLTSKVSTAAAATLIKLVASWARLAAGAGLPFGGVPAQDQIERAKYHVLSLAHWLRDNLPDNPALRADLRRALIMLPVVIPEPDALTHVLFSERGHGEDFEEHRRRRDDVIARVLPSNPESALAKLAELANASREAMKSPAFLYDVQSVIATNYADLRPWIAEIRKAELTNDYGFLYAEAYRREQLDVVEVQDALKIPAIRRSLVATALFERQVVDKNVLSSVAAPDLELLRFGVRNVPAAHLKALLSHADADVAAVTALLVLTPNKEEAGSLSSELDDIWRGAIKKLSLPLPLVLSDATERLGALVEFAPDEFARLLLEIPSRSLFSIPFAEREALEGIAPRLPAELRTIVLTEWHGALEYTSMLKLLAGADLDWLTRLLDAELIDENDILSVFDGNGPQPSLVDTARLLIPRGVDPVKVAAQIQWGTSVGEMHEVYASYLQYFDDLAEDPDPSVRALAKAGRAYFQPQAEAAAIQARRLDI